MSSRSPIRPGFLVGEGRSGTTLLSSILNRHPRLCVTPETHFFRLLHGYPGGAEAFALDWPKSLEWMVARMDPTPTWTPDTKHWLSSLPGISAHIYPGHERLFVAICDAYARSKGKSEWIEKTPPHIQFLPWLREHFPTAPIIHLVRDGRDVAHSLSTMKWSKMTREAHLLEWACHVGAARRYLNDDPYSYTIHYERLTEDPEQTIEDLCMFLGLKFDPIMLSPDGSENELIEIDQDHKELIRKPISRSRVGRWRTTYSPADQMRAERMIGHELAKWGYPLTNDRSNDRSLIVACQTQPPRDMNAYARIVANLCDQGHSVISTENLQDKAPATLPDTWLTTEPLPMAGDRSAVSVWIRAIRLCLRLQAWRSTEFHYFFRESSNHAARGWRLRRILQAYVARVAHTVFIRAEDDPILVSENLGIPLARVRMIGTEKSIPPNALRNK